MAEVFCANAAAVQVSASPVTPLLVELVPDADKFSVPAETVNPVTAGKSALEWATFGKASAALLVIDSVELMLWVVQFVVADALCAQAKAEHDKASPVTPFVMFWGTCLNSETLQLSVSVAFSENVAENPVGCEGKFACV